MKYLQLISSMCLALLILTTNLQCGHASKSMIDSFQSADFPAKVEYIKFPSGSMLSAASPLRWGSWTISFPPDNTPVATSGGGGDLAITGLIASNAVQGEKVCSFYQCRSCAFTNAQADRKQFVRRCRLTIGTAPKEQEVDLEIDCPVDVKLKQ